jgi:hypothetical protein
VTWEREGQTRVLGKVWELVSKLRRMLTRAQNCGAYCMSSKKKRSIVSKGAGRALQGVTEPSYHGQSLGRCLPACRVTLMAPRPPQTRREILRKGNPRASKPSQTHPKPAVVMEALPPVLPLCGLSLHQRKTDCIIGGL